MQHQHTRGRESCKTLRLDISLKIGCVWRTLPVLSHLLRSQSCTTCTPASPIWLRFVNPSDLLAMWLPQVTDWTPSVVPAIGSRAVPSAGCLPRKMWRCGSVLGKTDWRCSVP